MKIRLLIFGLAWAGLAAAAPAHSEGPAIMACRLQGQTPMTVFIYADRTGDLMTETDLREATHMSSPITVGIDTQKNKYLSFRHDEVGGYYFAHDKLLIYINDLVNPDEAILDLSYNFKSGQGSAIIRQREQNEDGLRKVIGKGPIRCTSQ